MSVRVNVRMSKIMHAEIKSGICMYTTYMRHTPIVEPCLFLFFSNMLKFLRLVHLKRKTPC